ncbi:MAG TPA: AmmeMemoRadiSam system protein A, partial [bacterium (Candidatus Stahlbacteria)]|nr:AmmeMemoRadiSam system protein A [Candidatus Stahlbacteria bacterium]
SSDLSHYHPYGEAVVIDRRTIKHIKNFEIEPLYQDLKTRRCEACGGAAIITGLYLSRMFGADKVKPLYYSNSGDVTGDSSRVVGYLAAVVYKKERKEIGVGLNLSDDDKRTLRKIASGAIKAVVRNEKFVMPEVSGRLKEKSGAFVTITKQGRLRGCIGFIIGIKPLYETVSEAAQSAATRDSRFPPLSPEELKDIEIEISVLTEPVLVRDLSEIKVGRDGLIIKRGLYQGLLLPQVAVENDWDLDEFLAHTCVKAGLSPDAWKKKGTSIYRFSAEVF